MLEDCRISYQSHPADVDLAMTKCVNPISCSARLPGMGNHGGMSTSAISSNPEDRDRDERFQQYTALIINNHPGRRLHGTKNPGGASPA